MTSWIGRSRITHWVVFIICCLWTMVSLESPSATVSQKTKASFTQHAKQYRLYAAHVAPLFNALHQAEALLERPETLTLQRWSAWLGGWDGYYQNVMQEAKEAHFGHVKKYQSYRQLVQANALLHQVQQRMQQQYLGLPTNIAANADTLDKAYLQVQACLATEETMQPLLKATLNQTGRR